MFFFFKYFLKLFLVFCILMQREIRTKKSISVPMPSNCQCCFHVKFFMTQAVLLYLYHVILPVRKRFDFNSSVDCGCMPACLRACSTVANVSEWESVGETGLLKPTVSF